MTENEKLEAVLNGEIRIHRFTREEQAGCSDPADRFLWSCILRAERELVDSKRRDVRTQPADAALAAFVPFRFLSEVAEPLPGTPEALYSQFGRYADRGRESAVYDGGDCLINKIRRMNPSILSGYLAPLANIVYHNRLFPKDRYTLEGIYQKDLQFFMLLTQEAVDIKLDANDVPVRPTAAQIRAAMKATGVTFQEFSSENAADDGSTESPDSEDNAEHLRFYNADYYISDLQPGRNTVIDARTGDVRFIDPRITLNDPNGPMTHVNHLGRRHEECPGQMI